MNRRQSRRACARWLSTDRSPASYEIQKLEIRRLFAAVVTFPFSVSRFVEAPNQATIYATDPTDNAVAVIDASTLTLIGAIPVGSNPEGLAITPDGSTVYVADAGASQIDVIDTQTMTAGTPIALSGSQEASSIALGTNNRLWILTASAIEQIDATTGASTGPNLSTTNPQPALVVDNGTLLTSPDQNSLYYGQSGFDELYKFDVSGTTPTETWGVNTGLGGVDTQLSNDGSLVVHPTSSPNLIKVYQASGAAALGTLNMASAPSAFAFSPDNAFGYAGAGNGSIEIFGLANYLQTTAIATLSTPNQLFVDNSGQYLFSSESGAGATEVFATGRSIPVPPVVTTQPLNQSVSGGSSVSFTAAASGSPTPTVQWQQSANSGNTWANIGGATGTTYTIPTAGPDSGFEFRAVFTNAGGTATSNAATLTVANNDKLAFTQQPTGTVSGLILSPSMIVDVETASGSLLAADNSLVTLSISSGPSGATLVGGAQANAINGVATFSSVSLPAAGAYVIEARDGTVTPAFSASFTSTGVPSLVFAQQPTNGASGTPLSPPVVVDVDSPTGPLATTDDSIVTLSILTGPSGANLGGTVTVNAVGGVATFNDIVPTVPGTYTLLATDTGYTSATSTSFQAAQGAGGATTTILASSANPVASGSALTLTATVSSASGTPSGTVQFFDGGVSLGMESLSNGKATLNTSGLAAGTQYITAAYFGTAGFIGSTSTPLIESVASQASLSAVVSSSAPAVFVPGSTGSMDVNITNQGASVAHGVVSVQLFATTDGIATDGIALLAHPLQVAVQLRGGASRTIHVSFVIPSTVAPGAYSVIAVLTPVRGLTAANISSAPQVGNSFSSATFSLSFGLVGGRHGVKLVRTEPDGTVVTYTLAGPGTGTLSGDGITSPNLSLSGTTSASRVTITTRGGSGGVTLAGLSANSPVGAISAPGATLAGVLDVGGSLGKLVLASLNGGNLAAASFGSVLIEGAVTNSKLLAGTSFGANGIPGGGDDTFAAGTINSIRILGNVTSSILAAGLNPVDGIYLNGNDTLISGGRIGSVAISGTLSSDSRVLAAVLPRTALVSHVAVDTTTDPRFTF